MCGRYTLSAGHETLARAFLAEFSAEIMASWKSRYNVSPGTGILAVVEDRDKGRDRRGEILHWGLVPGWAKDANIGYKLINARAETIFDKPSYRDAFRYRRCLVPASGFYEWDRRRQPRQPYYFHPKKSEIMAMAAVWEHWLHPTGSEILSVALVTREADSEVGAIHHRMPLLLQQEAWEAWLDTRNVKPDIKEFLAGAEPDGFLASHPVSLEVNKGSSEGAGLIQPVAAEGGKKAVADDQMELF